MAKKKIEKVKLIPPDKKRCQAEKRHVTFMSLGGGNCMHLVRCNNKPSWIITEKDPGPDGQHGSMSVCDACLEIAKTAARPFTKKAI